MNKAYLGIGSNIGNKELNIKKAIELMSKDTNIEVIKSSSYYKTEPVGYKEQDWFVNVVIKISTVHEPYELLEVCNNIEKKLKRERLIRWGPRTIDIDILIYKNIVLEEDKLTIPHPRMKERAFVMVPLYEIEPEMRIQDEHISLIINKIEKKGVKKLYD